VYSLAHVLNAAPHPGIESRRLGRMRRQMRRNLPVRWRRCADRQTPGTDFTYYRLVRLTGSRSGKPPHEPQPTASAWRGSFLGLEGREWIVLVLVVVVVGTDRDAAAAAWREPEFHCSPEQCLRRHVAQAKNSRGPSRCACPNCRHVHRYPLGTLMQIILRVDGT